MRKINMIKILLCTMAMFLSTTSSVAQTLTGSLGDNATYTIDGTTLTISGTGALPDYTTKRDNKSGTITFTSPLLQGDALTAMQNVTSVVFGDGITSIGDYTMSLTTTTAVSISFPCTLVPVEKTKAIVIASYAGSINILAPTNSAAYTDYGLLVSAPTGARYRKRTRAHAHVQPISAVSATCTTGGNNLFYHCSGCDQYATADDFATLTSVAEQQIDALGHTMTHHDRVEPTCEEGGLVAYYECTRCNHNYSDAEGTSLISDLSTDALGHAMAHHDRVEPTCEEDGTVAYYECTRCNHIYSDAEGTALLTDLAIEALGHQPVYHPFVKSTCEEKGTVAYYECTRCNNNYSDESCTTLCTDITIPASGHRAVYVSYTAATCAKEGNVVHYRCPDCGGVSLYQDRCKLGYFDDISTVTIPKAPHSDIRSFSASEPTCTSAGRKDSYRCSACYTWSFLPDCSVPVDYDTEVKIPALGHDLVHYEAEGATCTAYSHTDYDRCSRCSRYCALNAETGEWETVTFTQFQTDEQPLGHDMTEVSEINATCTTDGMRHHYHCERCGNNYLGATGSSQVSDSYLTIPASHKYYSVSGSAQTCTTAGSLGYYYCYVCNKEFVKDSEGAYVEIFSHDGLDLPALGHDLVNLRDEWITSSATGMPEVWHCTRCRKFCIDAELTTEITAEYIYSSAFLGTGTEQNPYVIATEGDLKAMGLATNYAWNTTGLYFDITRNITVTGEFPPICTANAANYFRGTIRGHHHAITFDNAKAILQGSYKGFIGKANEASLSNLTLCGTIDWGGGYQSCVGSFCGLANYSTFKGLRNYISYSNLDLVTAFGAIVGSAYESELHGCENHAPLKSYAKYFGGLVGNSDNTVIQSCSNDGSLTTGGTALAYVGGLAGSVSESYSRNALANCYNASGIIEGAGTSSKYMGYLFGTLNSGRVNNCLYEGNVTLPLEYGYTGGTTSQNISNCHTRGLNTDLDELNTIAKTYSYEPWVRNTSVQPTIIFQKQQSHYLIDNTQTTLADLPLLIKWLNNDEDSDYYWQCDFNKDGIFDISDMEEVRDTLLGK